MTASSPAINPMANESERYQEALCYLYGRINYERGLGSGATRYPFRLQRVTELIRSLHLQRYLYTDNPSAQIPLVHIAGTKGKGSVAAMVSSALTSCGLRTGLYTSPHLHRLEERFRIDGVACRPADLVSLVERMERAVHEVERTSGAPSFFELTTAMAMLHFDASGCDAVVMEVGLGGRLDSTNVFSPSVSVITSIGLDHQHVLGHDLPTIAAEKAGIIKPNVPVISGVIDADAAAVIRRRAEEVGTSLYQIGRDFTYDCQPLDQWGSIVRYRGITPPLSPEAGLQLTMEGRHQAHNAAIALATIDVLRASVGMGTASNGPMRTDSSPTRRGFELPLPVVQHAISQLQCEARIERIPLGDNVLAIVDASHNEDSVKALCQCLEIRSKNRPVIVVFGTSLDKSADRMLEALADVSDQLILTRYHGNPRFRPPDQLAQLVPEAKKNQTTVVEDPIAACQRGLNGATPGGIFVICGSFFLAAETRDWLRGQSQRS